MSDIVFLSVYLTALLFFDQDKNLASSGDITHGIKQLTKISVRTSMFLSSLDFFLKKI